MFTIYSADLNKMEIKIKGARKRLQSTGLGLIPGTPIVSPNPPGETPEYQLCVSLKKKKKKSSTNNDNIQNVIKNLCKRYVRFQIYSFKNTV